MTDLKTLENAVAKAREKGDAKSITDALIPYANALLQDGHYTAARDALDDAARIHQQEGNEEDVLVTLQFAQVASRLATDYEDTIKRGEHLLTLIDDKAPFLIQTHTEMGDASLNLARLYDAISHYTAALNVVQNSDKNLNKQIDLYKKRASARLTTNDPEQHEEAFFDLDSAKEILQVMGDESAAVRVMVQEASLLYNIGQHNHSKLYTQNAQSIAERLEDNYILAELHLLKSAFAVDDKNLDDALDMALKARQYALDTPAPVSYVTAAFAISEIQQLREDKLGAYSALATGWVTLEDISGTEFADATFRPRMLNLRDTWGADEFAQVKASYEQQQRNRK